ncbi:MAG: maleylpyruvate isomerase family mycothiol-dependent enzyme [Ilumatobacter sp.]|uniref:maleylpyruvate isomerase family mycothiol-dependent enzyme n=1 Tax=Ilumatobacter sp. TaxID=1967498 RepID=UPI003C725DB5
MLNDTIEWAECAEEYDACRRRIDGLVRDADEAMMATIVPTCPDWSVADLCAHLAGVPVALVSGDLPSGDTDQWVDAQVTARRKQPVAASLDEWEDATPAFQKMMVDAGGSIAGLILDAVAHEHDLRHALGAPGARDSRGVVLSVGFTKMLMDRDLRANESGAVVHFACDRGAWQAGGGGEPSISLDVSGRPDGAFELMRALGSRRSLRQLQDLPWRGDWEAERDSIFHMALPERDVDESPNRTTS